MAKRKLKKRAQGSGSYDLLPSGKYRLRYKGKPKIVEAPTPKDAARLLQAWVDETDRAEANGPDISMNDLV